jgi:hypothetical protein
MMIEELEVEKEGRICREKKVVFWRKSGKIAGKRNCVDAERKAVERGACGVCMCVCVCDFVHFCVDQIKISPNARSRKSAYG